MKFTSSENILCGAPDGPGSPEGLGGRRGPLVLGPAPGKGKGEFAFAWWRDEPGYDEVHA